MSLFQTNCSSCVWISSQRPSCQHILSLWIVSAVGIWEYRTFWRKVRILVCVSISISNITHIIYQIWILQLNYYHKEEHIVFTLCNCALNNTCFCAYMWVRIIFKWLNINLKPFAINTKLQNALIVRKLTLPRYLCVKYFTFFLRINPLQLSKKFLIVKQKYFPS